MTTNECIANRYASELKECPSAQEHLPAPRRADPCGGGSQVGTLLLRESIGLDELV